MKSQFSKRREIITNVISGQLTIARASQLLFCHLRTVKRYKKAVQTLGDAGLIDHRHSNNYKLTETERLAIINLKKHHLWRSGRNIRDALELSVSETTVGNVIRAAGLSKQNLKRVKPIIRFEAAGPNDMWQTDIMGRIDFPNIGILYLIASLDDYSRFVPAGRWFRKQGKMNVFQIWYESLARWGLPDAMLQDEGSQFKARTRFGQADYQWYAAQLDVKLIWARRAQTKGKIERFWRFVQDDFVREVWRAKTIDEVNGKFKVWLARYNWRFRSRAFGGQTRASRYRQSDRRMSRVELQNLLVVEERRRVSRQSTISLYGQQYYIPPGYINCHIWVKVIGNKVLFEANNEVFWKTRLKTG